MIDRAGANPAALAAETAQAVLARRAQVLSAIRSWFATQGVMEVETPLLGRFAASDPQLDNIAVDCPAAIRSSVGQPALYLQTSPESAMKKLLSLGSGSIYQLSKAFRQDPAGRLHAPEFTLLEWYRVDFDMQALMGDVTGLLNHVLGSRSVEHITYREAFRRYADIDPMTASIEELKSRAQRAVDVGFDDNSRDTWLDLLLTHLVEPHLGKGTYTFLYDYPASQAAMAQLEPDGDDGLLLAKRFELYINGIEIANGYQELTDPVEQRRRFEEDNSKREKMGKPAVVIDKELLLALQTGLPDCSGVALGVDRLIMVGQAGLKPV